MGSQRNSYQQRRRSASGPGAGASVRSNQKSEESDKKRFTFGLSRGSREGADQKDAAGANQTVFTPQQQKVIIEHLLITKSTAPQKNYSHVPCKFFRQGSCQAGSSCPFSHSIDTNAADQTPCEYFKRGNCKFGSKCANAHILDDGVRVNPPRQYKSRPHPHHQNRGTDVTFQAPPPMSAMPVESCIYEEGEQAVDDSLGDVFEGEGEDECEEFYIPTDFADLLTPEELKRRNSRSSCSSISSSFKRPEFTHSRSLSSSSSSFGSDPLFSSHGGNAGYHQRTHSGASLSSSNSSSTTSPLLHQQLSYLQQPKSMPPPQTYFNYNHTGNNNIYGAPKTQQSTKVNYSPWSPMLAGNQATRSTMSWLGNDLTKLKIDEESDQFSSTGAVNLPTFGQDPNSIRQDTQFFFDDIPVSESCYY